jgi:hypothetical protein
MVPRTGQLPKYPVDNIIEPMSCTLQVPVGRALPRKKDVATGVALPPNSGAMYNGKPISPNYARVDVTWTNKDFNEDEIDIPIKEGYRFIGATIDMCVLWKKSDIILDMPTSASQPLHPLSSPRVTRVMTTTMTVAAMTTTMLVAQAPVLQAVHLLATSIHREA